MGETSKSLEDIYIEEYRALRAESLRCAQLISNTSWIGFSGFVLTAGAGEKILKENPDL